MYSVKFVGNDNTFSNIAIGAFDDAVEFALTALGTSPEYRVNAVWPADHAQVDIIKGDRIIAVIEPADRQDASYKFREPKVSEDIRIACDDLFLGDASFMAALFSGPVRGLNSVLV